MVSSRWTVSYRARYGQRSSGLACGAAASAAPSRIGHVAVMRPSPAVRGLGPVPYGRCPAVELLAFTSRAAGARPVAVGRALGWAGAGHGPPRLGAGYGRAFTG